MASFWIGFYYFLCTYLFWNLFAFFFCFVLVFFSYNKHEIIVIMKGFTVWTIHSFISAEKQKFRHIDACCLRSCFMVSWLQAQVLFCRKWKLKSSKPKCRKAARCGDLIPIVAAPCIYNNQEHRKLFRFYFCLKLLIYVCSYCLISLGWFLLLSRRRRRRLRCRHRGYSMQPFHFPIVCNFKCENFWPKEKKKHKCHFEN